jgi:hypothetical protein
MKVLSWKGGSEKRGVPNRWSVPSEEPYAGSHLGNVAGNRTVVRFSRTQISRSRADGRSYVISGAASTDLISNGDNILSIAGRSTEST